VFQVALFGRTGTMTGMKDRTKIAIAIVYLVTGLLTGWQVYRQIMWAIWGAPTSPWQGVAVAGAFVLLFAVPTLFARSFAGVVVGGIGCAQLWSFYLPAYWNTIRLLYTQNTQTEFRREFSALAFLPLALLVAATILTLFGLFKYRIQSSEKP
jgi:hypothetical protein